MCVCQSTATDIYFFWLYFFILCLVLLLLKKAFFSFFFLLPAVKPPQRKDAHLFPDFYYYYYCLSIFVCRCMQLLSATIVLSPPPIFGHVEILNLFEVKNLCLSILYMCMIGVCIYCTSAVLNQEESITQWAELLVVLWLTRGSIPTPGNLT